MDTSTIIFLAAARGWEFWPFEGVEPLGGVQLLAKIVLVAVFCGIVLMYLRKLFGPGGRWRPDGLETIQEAKAREAKERQEREQAAAPPQAGSQQKEQEKGHDQNA